MLLIHILNEAFYLYYILDIKTYKQIVIEKEVFSNNSPDDGFICFYDWLREDLNSIIGISVHYFDCFTYNQVLSSKPYTQSGYQGAVNELYFGKSTVFNPNISGDQDFTNTHVYRSALGNYVLTFGLDGISAEELLSLKKYCLSTNDIELI